MEKESAVSSCLQCSPCDGVFPRQRNDVFQLWFFFFLVVSHWEKNVHAAPSVSGDMDFTDMYSPSFLSPFSSVTLTKRTFFHPHLTDWEMREGMLNHLRSEWRRSWEGLCFRPLRWGVGRSFRTCNIWHFIFQTSIFAWQIRMCSS